MDLRTALWSRKFNLTYAFMSFAGEYGYKNKLKKNVHGIEN
jgi:hypothetical protein